MRHYRVNRIEHVVFDSSDEVPSNITYLENWKDGIVGDWVLADDNCIIQILREGVMLKPKGKIRKTRYIGTCTGSFIVSDTMKMDTSRRVNIYSFGGNVERNERLEVRENLSTREGLFVQYMASGVPPQKAYLKAFPTNNPSYAGFRAGQLIRTTRVKTAMKEELKPVLEALNIDERYILEEIRSIIDTAPKEDTKLKALFKLADIMDMEDKNRTQVTSMAGALFQGFSPEALESVERPKEIENG